MYVQLWLYYLVMIFVSPKCLITCIKVCFISIFCYSIYNFITCVIIRSITFMQLLFTAFDKSQLHLFQNFGRNFPQFKQSVREIPPIFLLLHSPWNQKLYLHWNVHASIWSDMCHWTHQDILIRNMTKVFQPKKSGHILKMRYMLNQNYICFTKQQYDKCINSHQYSN